MSVIVSDDLLPGPPMERLGFSLAGMASAGTPDQATAAAAAVLGAAEGLRVGFSALRTNRDRLVHDTGAAEPSRVRELLDRALEAERHLTDAVVLLRCFVAKAGAAHGRSDAARLRDFADELDAEFLPLMRALRADVICVIAERARRRARRDRSVPGFPPRLRRRPAGRNRVLAGDRLAAGRSRSGEGALGLDALRRDRPHPPARPPHPPARPMIPTDGLADSSGNSFGWYRAPGWRAAERKTTDYTSRRMCR